MTSPIGGAFLSSSGYRPTYGAVVTSKEQSDIHRRTHMADNENRDQLLTPSEVAQMFRVNPKTVTRWARAGKITAIRTLGGHRRFRAAEVEAFLAQAERA